jgi:sugar transferase (PEP-CTERM system associated)
VPDLQEPAHVSFNWALLLALALMLLYRVFAAERLSRNPTQERVLVYGAGPEALEVGQLLKDADPNVDLVGYFARPRLQSRRQGQDHAQARPNLFLTGSSLTEVVRKERVGEIVIAVPGGRGGNMPLHELLDCKVRGIQVMDIATHFEKALGQIRRDAVSAGWLIFGEGFEQGLVRRAVKRSFDIVCALLLLLQSGPIMLAAAVAIYLESGGPVLYRQERVGLHGRRFTMVKFRSMRSDAEGDGIARWATQGDPRVTRVGHFIRMHRIDELPQLFNVLMGDMSLIGPRPERAVFVDKLKRHIAYYDLRHNVKPGITGWAQVRYHYGASEEDAGEKLQYDLYYVKNQCLLLDLVILVETVGVVLACKGAQ